MGENRKGSLFGFGGEGSGSVEAGLQRWKVQWVPRKREAC
jgi:hypothetical protein